MMLCSSEIRWFIPIEPSDAEAKDEILSWFKNGQPLKSEGFRVDEYLLFPDCDTVGVKLREKKLEVKAIHSLPRPLNIRVVHNGQTITINGRTDQWVKWSFDLEDGLKQSFEGELLTSVVKTLSGALKRSDAWVAVNKDRYLRKFSADSHRLKEVPNTDRPSKGCNVELTVIKVQGNPEDWLTLGFESFSPQTSDTFKILDEAIRLFFELQGSVPGQPLSRYPSLSYSAWLATLW
jgi:hypothetical protein